MAVISIPGTEDGNPSKLFRLENYKGINTQAQRVAIEDDEFSWLENFIPIGPGNLRTVYSNGTPIYTAANGRTIIAMFHYDIGANQYMAVFLDNGTADQVDLSSNIVTHISSTANTFYNGGATLPCACQWQSTYLVIVSQASANGYWLWDGTTLFKPGGLSPFVNITNSGSGYTTAPTIAIAGGSGSGATATATVSGGSVVSIKITNPGTGYVYTDNIVMNFTGGGSTTSAKAHVTLTSGAIATAVVDGGGTGYTYPPLVAIVGGGGSGASITAVLTGTSVASFTVAQGGSGYTTAPTVTVSGSATGTAVISNGSVIAITVTGAGSSYTEAPSVTIAAPTGAGGTQAYASANLTPTSVASLTINSPGQGFTTVPVLQFSAGGSPVATATVSIMPFGLSGSTLDTLQNRIWIGDNADIFFSAPGDPTDFSAANGGGAFPITDSCLKVSVTRVIAVSGFLYILGDASIFVFSNIQQTATGTTVFDFTNVDPQVGTSWRDSVQVFGRTIMFANLDGIYALSGGSAEKVSDNLNGIFDNAIFDNTGVTPISCLATLFNIKCFSCLITITDPFTGIPRNATMMTDGKKWWVGSQDAALTLQTTVNNASLIQSYGSDGTNIFETFNTSSTTLTKKFQSKLTQGDASFMMIKKALRYYLNGISIDPSGYTAQATIDADQDSSPVQIQANQGILTFINYAGGVLQFQNNSNGNLIFGVAGFAFTGQTCNESGHYLGTTVTSTSPDFVVIGVGILYQDFQPDA